MCRRLARVVVLAACCCAAASSQAAEDLFKLVPDSALGFAVVNRPGAVDAKLQQVQRQLGVPAASLAAKLKEEAGTGEGLDERGAVGLLVLPPEGQDGPPGVILLVPVSDYGKFLQPLEPKDAEGGLSKIDVRGKDLLVRQVGGYAALAEARLRTALENVKAAKAPAGLAPWSQWMAGNDAGLVVLQPGIKLISGKVQSAIGAMKTTLAMAGDQGKAAAAGLDLYVKCFQYAEKEVALFAVAVKVDPQGTVRLASRTRAVPGGRLARLLAGVKPADEDLLAGLPAGPFVAAGGGTVPQSGWEGMMQFSIDMMTATRDFYGVSEEQLRKMKALPLEWTKSARSFSAVFGVGKAGEPLYSRATVVFRADNAQAFLADYEKYLGQYAAVAKEGSSLILPAMEMERTKIGGAAALQISMQLKAPPGAPKAAEIDRMMELMFGPGGKVVAWIAAADERTLVVGYTDKAHLERTVEAVKQGRPGLPQEAGTARTAALLPKGAPLVVYISPRGTLEFFRRFLAAAAPPEAASKIKLPDFPQTPPVGLAVSAAPDELRTELVVPPEVLQGVGEVVRKGKGGE